LPSGARQVDLTEEQGQAFVKFWRNQKSKIHDVLVSQSLWTNRLSAVNWRIDVKTKSKNIQDLNEPAAIVELEIKTPAGKVCFTIRSFSDLLIHFFFFFFSSLQKEALLFEMDAQKVNEIVAQIEAIQKVIS